jgi:hypothetical protein
MLVSRVYTRRPGNPFNEIGTSFGGNWSGAGVPVPPGRNAGTQLTGRQATQ